MILVHYGIVSLFKISVRYIYIYEKGDEKRMYVP